MERDNCIRVAMVEDDPLFRDAVRNMLDRQPGMMLHAVAISRAEGVAMLQGAAADVLLADIGLPDGSGLDVLKEAVTRWPSCAVLISTTFGDESYVMDAIALGAAGYLLKDASEMQRVEAIRTSYEGGSPISPMIARQVLSRFRHHLPVPAARTAPALSEREREVLRHVSQGFTEAEIAARLEVSTHTIHTYVRRIYQKLSVSSRIEAVTLARRQGWLDG
ncbi:LuxR family transcriptional regulator [Komagataeibacter intermedius AF2]|uniref:LuxR family transcriptional regulator n=1 Tax=Komagataeibacter intermedius AF2 TaxID=1458464 RepID=A0A0N1N5T7_9PROT|nr:response regulator transcription factor [Komagataeibacter intermedius]KPH86598.1 LuxR family transcriptional regulator [Komagataeibacter intermedius AF2]